MTATTCRIGVPSLIPCLLGALLLSSCGATPRVVPPHATPSDFGIIRSYGWDVDVSDPQGTWSPNDYRVLVRYSAGFAVLHGNDGSEAPDLYRSIEGRVSYFPQWVNPDQVVFGPQHNVERLADGRVVPVVEGLTLVSLGAQPKRKQLTRMGYRPRVGQDAIFAQSEDRMIQVDEHGGVVEFGRGFYAEPQRNGPGVAWQETPVFETDWWTGRTLRSQLVIRWKPGAVDILPAAVQPTWSLSGGLAATVLRDDPKPGTPWWACGTDVVFIPSSGKPPMLIAHDARDPAPHPTEPVIAVATRDGSVCLVSTDGSQQVPIGPGCNPRWSSDGTRLLVQSVPGPTGADATAPETCHLTVYVLVNRTQTPPAAPTEAAH